MKISLCLMVWNELEGCKIDVPPIPKHLFSEVYAIDGGSTDGTVEFLKSKGIQVIQQRKKGLNAAYIDANYYSNCDYVVVFFPKGTVSPEYLKEFKPFFEQGFELVIPSRQIAGSLNEEDCHWWRPRKWAVWSLAFISMIFWRREGYWVRDVLHGFKGWKKTVFEKMDILETGLSIDIEMVIRSYKQRIPRIEFPISETQRPHNASHFKFWPTGSKLLRYFWFEIGREC